MMATSVTKETTWKQVHESRKLVHDKTWGDVYIDEFGGCAFCRRCVCQIDNKGNVTFGCRYDDMVLPGGFEYRNLEQMWEGICYPADEIDGHPVTDITERFSPYEFVQVYKTYLKQRPE